LGGSISDNARRRCAYRPFFRQLPMRTVHKLVRIDQPGGIGWFAHAILGALEREGQASMTAVTIVAMMAAPAWSAQRPAARAA
jgi:hypothetical protein